MPRRAPLRAAALRARRPTEQQGHAASSLDESATHAASLESPPSGESRNSSISTSGPTWWFDMNTSTWRPVRRSTALMNLSCMAFWNAIAVSWTIVFVLEFDHGLLHVGVDAAEHTGEQIIAELVPPSKIDAKYLALVAGSARRSPGEYDVNAAIFAPEPSPAHRHEPACNRPQRLSSLAAKLDH